MKYVLFFLWMKNFYFQVAGWDPATGIPLPHTLKALGLENLIPDIFILDRK